MSSGEARFVGKCRKARSRRGIADGNPERAPSGGRPSLFDRLTAAFWAGKEAFLVEGGPVNSASTTFA